MSSISSTMIQIYGLVFDWLDVIDIAHLDSALPPSSHRTDIHKILQKGTVCSSKPLQSTGLSWIGKKGFKIVKLQVTSLPNQIVMSEVGLELFSKLKTLIAPASAALFLLQRINSPRELEFRDLPGTITPVPSGRVTEETNRVFQNHGAIESITFNCKMDENVVKSILRCLPKLRKLQFGIGIKLSTEIMSVVAEMCHSLEELIIESVAREVEIYQLKLLEVIFNNRNTLKTFAVKFLKLSETHLEALLPAANQLERLEFQSQGLPYNQLQSLLIACTQLRVLAMHDESLNTMQWLELLQHQRDLRELSIDFRLASDSAVLLKSIHHHCTKLRIIALCGVVAPLSTTEQRYLTDDLGPSDASLRLGPRDPSLRMQDSAQKIDLNTIFACNTCGSSLTLNLENIYLDSSICYTLPRYHVITHIVLGGDDELSLRYDPQEEMLSYYGQECAAMLKNLLNAMSTHHKQHVKTLSLNDIRDLSDSDLIAVLQQLQCLEEVKFRNLPAITDAALSSIRGGVKTLFLLDMVSVTPQGLLKNVPQWTAVKEVITDFDLFKADPEVEALEDYCLRHRIHFQYYARSAIATMREKSANSEYDSDKEAAAYMPPPPPPRPKPPSPAQRELSRRTRSKRSATSDSSSARYSNTAVESMGQCCTCRCS